MTRDPAPLSRRRLLQLSGGAGALLAAAAPDGEAQAPAVDEAPEAVRALRPMTDGVSPIAPDEHRARLARAQKLLAESGLDAMVVGPGSSLAYYTGAEWGLSERFLGVVLGRTREPIWVVPAFEKDRALEKIRVGTDVRPWAEDEAPYRLVAAALADLGVRAGRVGIEETMPFAFSDGIGGAAPAARLASATPVTAGCRQVKDAHELAEGLTVAQVAGWVAAAHRGLGFRGGALVLFGPDAAFPHGTARPKLLARGDVVLVDGGCRVHGYESDITRTGVFGAPPTDRQRRIWDLVRKAQKAAHGPRQHDEAGGGHHVHGRARDLRPRRARHPPRGHARGHGSRLREPRAEVVGHAGGAGGGVSYSRQFSTFRPFTRPNSAVSSVTTVSPRDSAWAAMSMSFGPIGVPPASSRARTRPYVAAARRSKSRTSISSIRASMRVWFARRRAPWSAPYRSSATTTTLRRRSSGEHAWMRATTLGYRAVK
jgi:Xaa-Pro dipeptidase